MSDSIEELVISARNSEKIKVEKNIRAYIYKNICDLGIKVKDDNDNDIPVEELDVEAVVGVLVDTIKALKVFHK